MSTTVHDFEDAVAAGAAAAGPMRLTAKEWRAWTRGRRTWRRRVALATLAVVIGEVACVNAWTALVVALDSPTPTPAGS